MKKKEKEQDTQKKSGFWGVGSEEWRWQAERSMKPGLFYGVIEEENTKVNLSC